MPTPVANCTMSPLVYPEPPLTTVGAARIAVWATARVVALPVPPETINVSPGM